MTTPMPARWHEALRKFEGVEVQQPETNLVFFETAGAGLPPQQLVAKLREHGVLISMLDSRRIRACTHLDVSAGDDHGDH